MEAHRPTRAEIRAKFEAGEITWEQVFVLLERAPKPWESPEWKARRDKLLKEKCEGCGSTEPPLYAQHHWHPMRFSELCEVAKDMLGDEYKAQHPREPPTLPPFDASKVAPQERTERDCCPQCNSVNVRLLKRSPKWRCNLCGTHFEKPNQRMYQRWDDDKWIEMARYNHLRPISDYDRKWENEFIEAFRERICTLATKLSFIEHDRYMAMLPEDVTTRCKRCAFKEDRWFTKGKFGKSIALDEERLREIEKRLSTLFGANLRKST